MLFKNIVLIDDDDSINYYHKYIIENENITKDLFVLSEIELAESVLADLCEKPPEEINPSLIFIDVNMPRYTGFQFIEQNKSMFEKLKAKGAKNLYVNYFCQSQRYC